MGTMVGMAVVAAALAFAVFAAGRKYVAGAMVGAIVAVASGAWLNVLGGYHHEVGTGGSISFLLLVVLLLPLAIVRWVIRLRGPERNAYEKATEGLSGATGLQPPTASTSQGYRPDPLDRM